MAMLTVADDRLREVDEFAKKEERSRDEIVDEAIEVYLLKKEWERMRQWGRELAATGITEEDVREEIKKCREEEAARRK
jgi:metal-responsive CopG/Arc/MetJ family transcriptional regulator